MPIIIIDNYDSFTYNLFQMVQALTTEEVKVFRNDAITFEELLALKPSRIILSPGPGHPGNPKDFQICRDIILSKELTCPILGVCLGHQGIVHHLGGTIAEAPEIVHGKTSSITQTNASPLLSGLSNPFQAMRYHSLVAKEENFPAELVITAKEYKNGLIMALQHKTRPLYGVQFHPESIGTPEGSQLLQNFLEKC